MFFVNFKSTFIELKTYNCHLCSYSCCKLLQEMVTFHTLSWGANLFWRLCCSCNCNNHFYKLKPKCDSAELLHSSILLIYSTTEPDFKLALFVMKSCKRNSWGDFLLQVACAAQGGCSCGEHPPPKAGSLISPAHAHTRGIEACISKGTRTDCSCQLWVGWFCWEMQLGAAAEHCWAPGGQGSSQAQTGREQSLENVAGCHLSSWHFTQRHRAFVAVCLSRKSSCGSKSWL